jgi:hypothetical protein
MEKVQKVFLNHQRCEKFQAKVDNYAEKFKKNQLKLHNELVKERIKNKGKSTYDEKVISKFAKSKEEKQFIMDGVKHYYLNEVSKEDLENCPKMVKKYSNFSKKIEFDDYKIDIEFVNNVGYKQKLPNFCFPSIMINTRYKKKEGIKYFQHVTVCTNSTQDFMQLQDYMNKCFRGFIISENKSKHELTFITSEGDIDKVPFVCKDNVFTHCPFWTKLSGIKSVNVCTCVVDCTNVIACIEWGFENSDKVLLPVAIQPVHNTNKSYKEHCQKMLNDILDNLCEHKLE